MRSPSKIVAVTPAAIEIEKRAIEREKKGQFRIAAHLWQHCQQYSKTKLNHWQQKPRWKKISEPV